VLANAVSQQTHEIGVRMALGARASQVVWSVLRRALVLAGAGIGVVIVASLMLARVMSGLLYEVRPTDDPALHRTKNVAEDPALRRHRNALLRCGCGARPSA
jgi:ABC-type antimicrobial peptide transport system permease subunit